jgi:hypothetical protein
MELMAAVVCTEEKYVYMGKISQRATALQYRPFKDRMSSKLHLSIYPYIYLYIYIYESRFYLTANTSRLHYRAQPVNAVKGYSRCLL